MSKRLDISVVIPAFNVAKYIGYTLKSVIDQDPPFKEIIVIDDGSTDNTGEIVRSYTDTRIIYHRQSNQGLGPARNKGIDLSCSEYIYFMDGDDILARGMTKFIAQTIGTSTERADIVLFSAVDFEDGSGKISRTSRYFDRVAPQTYQRGVDALIGALSRGTFPVCAFLYVFSRALLEEDPPLRFLNIIHEDEVFTPALLLRCHTTIVSNHQFYRRRIRTGSIMTTPASVRNVRGMLTASRWWLEQASGAHKEHSKAFLVQSMTLYSSALRYASRCNLGLEQTRTVVADEVAKYVRFVKFDYALSTLSKRLAYEFGVLRARILVRLHLGLFK